MENLIIMRLNKCEYYVGNELLETFKNFFGNCGNARKITNSNDITEDADYIYIYIYIWKVGTGLSKKFDQILILKKQIDEIVNEIEPNIDTPPDIIELDEHETFKDIEGNILEIEVRGQKITKCISKSKTFPLLLN
jgi:hypothetical protein